ncbi:MAG: nucleoside kinase [Candidatus Sumerlaeia bacterium]
MITVTLQNSRKVQVPKGTTLLELYNRCKDDLKLEYPPVAATIDNKIYDLHKDLNRDATVEFLPANTLDGHLVLQRSLSFLLVKAVKDLFPQYVVSIRHSLSKGLYCTIVDPFNPNGHSIVTPTPEELRAIENRMRDLTKADLPFQRVEKSKEEAMRFFKKHGQPNKAELLETRKSKTVDVYRLGNLYDHFYGILAPSTGYLQVFELMPYPPGFLLRFPAMDDPTQLPPFVDQRKAFQVYREYETWGRLLGIHSVWQLNKVVREKRIRDFILTAEALHEKRISQIADQIVERPDVRVVLVSGPTSSGKTTFSRRLAIQLQVHGRRCFPLQLDDYFVNRDQTPIGQDGEPDFEAFEAINSKAFIRDLINLLAGKRVTLRHFNFKKGRSEPGPKVKLEPGTIIIVEGIHGLNNRLTEEILEGHKFKIYVSALTQLNLDEHNRISTSDVRVLRRLIRDQQYRGYSPVETINRWASVRRGEEANIFPYQENCDVMFNSALPYELGVLKTYSEPFLEAVPRSEKVYSEARRLLKFTSYFLPIESEWIPPTSILREFIGGSCFADIHHG